MSVKIFRFNRRVKNLRSYLPILDVLKLYRREDFGHDAVAGFVVGVITIPQAVAYALLAGLPAEAGLYVCLVPMVLYSLLGSSRQLVVGPVAVAALMVAATVSEYAPSQSDEYLGITTALCLLSGAFLLLLRASNMGGIVNLLSHPVIGGFINAAAILIIVSQLSAFTGIEGDNGSNPVAAVMSLAERMGELSVDTTVLGAASLAALIAMQRYLVPLLNRLGANLRTSHPIGKLGPMFVASGGILAVWLLDLGGSVATVGPVPSGLPGFTLPPFDPELWLDLTPPAALIALVAYVESFSVGTTIATRQRQRINGNQELIALGVANLGAAFTGAYPVAGSFSRSSVNYQAGARSPVSSLVCAVIIVVTLLYLTPVIALLPHAALAAIIIVSVVGLMDWKSLRHYWQFYPQDAVTHVATIIGVLAFDVETGLIVGVVLSILFFVRRSSKPHIAVVGRVGDGTHFRNAKRYDVQIDPTIALVRVDENLFFANANQVENKLMKAIVRRPDTRHMVLVCSSINMVDASGVEMLLRVNDSFRELGIKLHLSDVKGPVLEQFEASHFTLELSGSLFFNADQAMRDLTAREA